MRKGLRKRNLCSRLVFLVYSSAQKNVRRKISIPIILLSFKKVVEIVSRVVALSGRQHWRRTCSHRDARTITVRVGGYESRLQNHSWIGGGGRGDVGVGTYLPLHPGQSGKISPFVLFPFILGIWTWKCSAVDSYKSGWRCQITSGVIFLESHGI